MEKMFSLKENVLAEPLVNQWYAWSYLISPATTAMIFSNSHTKILRSYLKSPAAHHAAVQNPALLGGPFVDYPDDRSVEIEQLLNKTEIDHGHLYNFAKAIQELNDLIKEEAKGESLIPLYPKIPPILKGYVELIYDLNHQPSFRFIESLLYKSPYYIPKAQSMLISVINQDYRPFALSTPRLENNSNLQINLPFSHRIYDHLFKLKYKPMSKKNIEKTVIGELDLNKDEENLFWTFFTEKLSLPNQDRNFTCDGVRIRYFGHASLLIQTNNINILVDPVISYNYENDIPRFTFKDLPEKIDYLVLTHGHQDHILLETLLQIRHRVDTVIVPRSGRGTLQDPSLKLFFQHIGFQKVIDLDEMEVHTIDQGNIMGIPFLGEHSDLNIGAKLIYLIEINNKKILCAADTNNLESKIYEYVHNIIGDVDVLFIGMECDGAPLTWLYGSLYTIPVTRQIDLSRRLNGADFENVINLVDRFNCKHVYVYAMGQEPWLNYIMCVKYTEKSTPIIESDKLVAECLRRGIVSERLFGKKELLI